MPRARVEERQPGQAERERVAPPPLPLHGVSNHALARRVAKPKETGLRNEAVVGRFAQKAVRFIRNNPGAELHHLARFLGAAANVELNALDIPDVRVIIRHGGKGGAHFDAAAWAMVIDEDGFTHREDVTTLGQLTDDEAAIIANTILHEARHAEQRFRVARLQAGEHAELGFEMDEDAAKAAAAKPMDQRKTPAREVAEAKEWRSSQMGEDALYREVVTNWQSEVKPAARAARDVTDDGPDVRDRIRRMFRSWNKPGGSMQVIRDHLPSARTRKKAELIHDIEDMRTRFDAAEQLLTALPPEPTAADFPPLAEELIQLVRAIDRAYRNVPVEKDAHAVGHATFDAVHAERAKSP